MTAESRAAWTIRAFRMWFLAALPAVVGLSVWLGVSVLGRSEAEFRAATLRAQANVAVAAEVASGVRPAGNVYRLLMELELERSQAEATPSDYVRGTAGAARLQLLEATYEAASSSNERVWGPARAAEVTALTLGNESLQALACLLLVLAIPGASLAAVRLSFWVWNEKTQSGPASAAGVSGNETTACRYMRAYWQVSGAWALCAAVVAFTPAALYRGGGAALAQALAIGVAAWCAARVYALTRL